MWLQDCTQDALMHFCSQVLILFICMRGPHVGIRVVVVEVLCCMAAWRRQVEDMHVSHPLKLMQASTRVCRDAKPVATGWTTTIINSVYRPVLDSANINITVAVQRVIQVCSLACTAAYQHV